MMTMEFKKLRYRLSALSALALLVLATSVRAASNPDFDAVTWTALDCAGQPLISHSSPSAVDLAGDATFPATYAAHDATYLYFRYRLDGNPTDSNGFASYSWTALMQVPSGDPFQYQYQLSLDGKKNAIEIWQNTVAEDVLFSPLFHDDAEVMLFSQPYALSNGSTVNTTPLARAIPTGDGSNFNGNGDFFLDFAFPISALIANGAISGAADLNNCFFFPATSTDPSNYNKGYLNCPFLPTTRISLDKSVVPTTASPNTTTPIVYSIAVHNEGPGLVKGIVIEDPSFPAFISNPVVSVSSDDPNATWTVVSANPLEVKVNTLQSGATVTVEISADAAPHCSDTDFTNQATAYATNAMQVSGSAVLQVRGLPEVCDGLDNNCNGQIDEGGNSLCDDGNVCNGVETCGGASGCLPGTPLNCDDGDPCTLDGCDPQMGCTHDPMPGCGPCQTAADCDDGNACTADSCDAGMCTHGAPPAGCVPCQTAADCDDGNACTADSCDAGMCTHGAPPAGCVPCQTAADCDDGNGCTADSCNAGMCAHATPPAGCVPCQTAADCDDHNSCTTELCTAGVCQHDARPGCIPCTSASDCDDHNPCTNDACASDGSCQITAIAGCQRCTTAADCDDGNRCTTDTCTGGVCTHAPIPQCPGTTEVCNDGIDNDGNGLVDCKDPACAQAPECRPREICGNCIDDDGDGLVDYEDPDCCAGGPMPATVARLGLRPTSKAHGNRLRMKLKLGSGAPALDPSTQDTSLQISDARGQLFCATIAAKNWKHPSRRLYRFIDKAGTFAGGLRNGRFMMKRNGTAKFGTRGRKMDLRATDGKSVHVTLRVGGMCARDTKTLRASKTGALLFP